MSNVSVKQLAGRRIEIKDADKGLVEAVIATFGVKDHDGDWTLPGAFEAGAPALISAYGHQSWSGLLPVGKGVLKTTDTDARFVGQFFMDTQEGAETFKTVKNVGDLQEWSYGFDVLERGEVTEELRQKGVYRVLKKLKVHEVSPVLLGAGIGTGTVAVKGCVVDGDAVRAAALREQRKFLLTMDRLRGRLVVS